MSKAFDTVNHSILLSKLEHYGIRGVGHSWFKSYLDNRTQIVTVNGEKSTELKINCDVPQGSILSPLLFLLYINDIYNSSEVLDFRLFADDTSILFADKSLDTIEQTVNYEMKTVSEWLLANKLSLNVAKSNFLIIRPHKNNRIVNLKINDENLKQETSSKYLGVLIDDKLYWKHHINQLNTKISKSIGILYKLRHLIPKSTLVTRYNSFIQSHVLYGLLNWGCANKTTLEPLKITLRKAVRVIDFASYTAHKEPIFKRFKLLNLENLYKLETAKFMFQINQENHSNFLQKEFIKTSKLHCYNTRQSSDLGFSLPSISTNFKKNFLTFDGVKHWNSLPIELKNIRNKNAFKKMMKLYLLQNS